MSLLTRSLLTPLVLDPSPHQERTPQRQPSSRDLEYSQLSGWSMVVIALVMLFRFMYEGSWTWHVVIFHV